MTSYLANDRRLLAFPPIGETLRCVYIYSYRYCQHSGGEKSEYIIVPIGPSNLFVKIDSRLSDGHMIRDGSLPRSAQLRSQTYIEREQAVTDPFPLKSLTHQILPPSPSTNQASCGLLACIPRTTEHLRRVRSFRMMPMPVGKHEKPSASN